MANEQWTELMELVQEAGDARCARQIGEAAAKNGASPLMVAFCGHFSAGKSTLINRLCGGDWVPSGPVPISANTVILRYGKEGQARVYWKATGTKEEALEMKQADNTRNRLNVGEAAAEVSPEQASMLCADGGVERVEIDVPMLRWGSSVAFLDTPGIDSTDDAHREATEAALHLADLVFYVTDYNHVLSEMNARFTKRLVEEGKPFYLIVNQVDKHREDELSFEQFRQKAEDTFADWGVRSDGFLFLSLKEEGHPLHEGERLFRLIDELAEHKDSWIRWSMRQSVEALVNRHVTELEEREAVRDGELLVALADWEEEGEPLMERIAALESEDRAWTERTDKKRQEGRKTADSLIANTNFIPADTRELARLYLESRDSRYRKGWFRRAESTEKERSVRLDEWQRAFRENAQVELEGHLTALLQEAAAEVGFSAEESRSIAADVEGVGAGLTSLWLAEQVQAGAVYSPEYAQTYARQAADAARAAYRRRAHDWLERAAPRGRARHGRRCRRYARQGGPARGEPIYGGAVRSLQRREIVARERASRRTAAARLAEPDYGGDLPHLAAGRSPSARHRYGARESIRLPPGGGERFTLPPRS